MIAQNISFFCAPMTIDQAENWCEVAQEGWDRDVEHLFIVRRKESGEAIGCISAHEKLKDYDAYEIGYWLIPSAQKQGFALEMLIRILDHIADYFAPKRIVATTALDNNASSALLEKCGFAYIGLEDVPTVDPEYFRPSKLYARPLANMNEDRG
jgi:RimJ/RimL family protein N-acetyltransferase